MQNICGSCNLQYIDYVNQLKIKQLKISIHCKKELADETRKYLITNFKTVDTMRIQKLAGVQQPFYPVTFIHMVLGKIHLEPKLIHKI